MTFFSSTALRPAHHRVARAAVSNASLPRARVHQWVLPAQVRRNPSHCSCWWASWCFLNISRDTIYNDLCSADAWETNDLCLHSHICTIWTRIPLVRNLVRFKSAWEGILLSINFCHLPYSLKHLSEWNRSFSTWNFFFFAVFLWEIQLFAFSSHLPLGRKACVRRMYVWKTSLLHFRSQSIFHWRFLGIATSYSNKYGTLQTASASISRRELHHIFYHFKISDYPPVNSRSEATKVCVPWLSEQPLSMTLVAIPAWRRISMAVPSPRPSSKSSVRSHFWVCDAVKKIWKLVSAPLEKANLAPKFVDLLTNRSVVEHEEILLECTVTGQPTPTITW